MTTEIRGSGAAAVAGEGLDQAQQASAYGQLDFGDVVHPAQQAGDRL
jgi:hypothetical protein